MRKKLLVLVVLFLAVVVIGCTGNPSPQPPGPPTPTPKATPTQTSLGKLVEMISLLCPGTPNPLSTAIRCLPLVSQQGRLLDCICGGGVPVPTGTSTAPPRTPAPTAAVTATPQPTPTPTIGPTATPKFLPTLACADKPGPSVYVGKVRQAMQMYQDQHPDQFEGSFFKWPLSQDAFLLGIAGNLQMYNLDGMIDPCNCGDFVVSDHDTPLGQGFSEGYHPISSQRIVQSAPYLGTCTPKWLGWDSAAPMATVVPAPSTPAPPAIVGPILLNIHVDKLTDGKYTGPDGTCQIINFTPHFLVNGRDVPCNRDHPNCGEGYNFEPDPAQVQILVISQAFPQGKGSTDEYLSRACGADGSDFTATATVPAGSTDRKGRLLNLRQFVPITLKGKI